MARLRREEEHRVYTRMTTPLPLSHDSPSHRFATAPDAPSAANAFSSTAAHTAAAAAADSDSAIAYSDVSRELTLILNILLSILACAAFIWVAAQWWDTPARLALSMSGSLLVGVAEVVVYSGYIRRVGEAKGKEGRVREVREVMRTWVVGGEDDDDDGVGKGEKAKQRENVKVNGEEKGREEDEVIGAVVGEHITAEIRERKRRKEDS